MKKSRTYLNETKVVVVEPASESVYSAWIFDIKANGSLVPSCPEVHTKHTLKGLLDFYGAEPVKKRLVLQ